MRKYWKWKKKWQVLNIFTLHVFLGNNIKKYQSVTKQLWENVSKFKIGFLTIFHYPSHVFLQWWGM